MRNRDYLKLGVKKEFRDLQDLEFVDFGCDLLDSEDLTNKCYESFLGLMQDKYLSANIREVGMVFKNGFYMPCEKRVTYTDSVDVGVDGMPRNFSFFDVNDKSYSYLEESNKLPTGVAFIGNGKKYKYTCCFINDDGIFESMSTYIMISKKGNIQASRMESPQFIAPVTMHSTKTANACSDSEYLWECSVDENIVSDTIKTRLRLGMNKEQVKSLLYARELPLTETGRKRPILHLVNAHKRRVKEGVDIDISKFVRGIDCVSIDGMTFNIKPPKRDVELTKNFNKRGK